MAQPPADVPAAPAVGRDATTPPPPVAVSIAAPLGQPVVLFRQGDPVGRDLRAALGRAGLLR